MRCLFCNLHNYPEKDQIIQVLLMVKYRHVSSLQFWHYNFPAWVGLFFFSIFVCGTLFFLSLLLLPNFNSSSRQSAQAKKYLLDEAPLAFSSSKKVAHFLRWTRKIGAVAQFLSDENITTLHKMSEDEIAILKKIESIFFLLAIKSHVYNIYAE